MNTQTFTPGPWWLDARGQGSIYVEAAAVIEKRLLQEICAVGPTEVGREQQEANARLIAAAPELLACVRSLMNFTVWEVSACNGMKCREPQCESCNGEEYASDYVSRARAAHSEAKSLIAKATGANHES